MIFCCKGCEAPKRHPGCHGKCEEYIKQKADYDKRKAELDSERKINQAILCERGKKVYGALKGYRKSKYKEK